MRGGQDEVAQGCGLVHVGAKRDLEGDVAQGLGHFVGLGQGVGRVGLVHEERGRSGLARGHVGQEACGVLVRSDRTADSPGGCGQQRHAAAHAAQKDVEGGARHEVQSASALAEGGTGDDQRGLGGLDQGGQLLHGLGLEPGGLLHFLRRVLGRQGLVLGKVRGGGHSARSDEQVGQAQREGRSGLRRNRQELVAHGGGVVQHRTGVDELGGGRCAGGARGGKGLLVGHGGAPGIERIRADHEHQVRARDVKAGLAGAAHELDALLGRELLARHHVVASVAQAAQQAGDDLASGAGLVAADGGDFAGLALERAELLNQERLGVLPLDGLELALAHLFQGRLDAGRAVHELGASRAHGAHAALAHGIGGVARHGKGKPANGLDLDGATGGAKFAQSGLGFHLARVQAGNPRPVLRPDGYIIQALPDDRREQGACNASHDDFDESSTIQTHLKHPSFTCGRRGRRC